MLDYETNRRRLWAMYEHVSMVIGLASLALICLVWLPVAMLLHPALPRPLGQRVGRLVIMRGFRFYLQLLGTFCACQFDLSALDDLREERNLIIAANHPSLLDAVLIISRLPNVVCVMKNSLMRHPLFGSGARLAGYIRNHGMVQIVQQSREAMQTGAHILIFPEGTRTREFPLSPLTPAIGLIAARSDAPVQTVILEFSTPYLGKFWPLFRRPVLPLRCRARLGRRFEVQNDHKQLTLELDAYLRQQLASSTSSAHDA